MTRRTEQLKKLSVRVHAMDARLLGRPVNAHGVTGRQAIATYGFSRAEAIAAVRRHSDLVALPKPPDGMSRCYLCGSVVPDEDISLFRFDFRRYKGRCPTCAAAIDVATQDAALRCMMEALHAALNTPLPTE